MKQFLLYTLSIGLVFALACSEVLAQGRTVTGKVIDVSTNEALPGVSVFVQGTTTGTTTDIDGNFSLNVPSGMVKIVFSSVGMTEQVIEVGASQTSISVSLTPDNKVLDEVLVVAYGEQSQASFTGSAAKVDPITYQKAPRVSFQESLQGNIAGVQVTSGTGQPGAGLNIRIRGISSFNGGSGPLYVVDGIPVVTGDVAQNTNGTDSNALAGLNPNDIENITILKDASATSIYGSRGANGVVIITTRSGKKGRMKIDVNAQYGFSDVTVADKHKPLNTAELSELLIEGRINRFGETQQEASDFILSRIDESVDTNWFDEVTRTGVYQQYNISASGGNDNVTYFISGALYNQEATIIGSDYQKENFRLNLKTNDSKRVTITTNLAFNHQDLNTQLDGGAFANPVRSIYRLNPWLTVRNEDGSFNTSYNATYNPVGLAERNINNSDIYNFLGGVGIAIDIVKGLSFETRGNIDFTYVDEYRYDNPEFGAGRNDNGRAETATSKFFNWNVSNLIRYTKTFAERYKLNVTLGQEAQKTIANSSEAEAWNFSDPSLRTLANASFFQNAYSDETANSLSSYFTSIGFSIDDKYFLNLTGRRDGSSRFGSEVRYANFGAIGLGWNIHQESFMSGASFINQLKLRTSYGTSGNQSFGNFESQGLYSTGTDYDGSPGTFLTQVENPQLTWEKNIQFNVGLDFGFFNRISGTVEFYQRNTQDLLFNTPISSTNGVTTVSQNLGEFKNTGIEFSITSQNIVPSAGDGFSWSTSFNITTQKNEILALEGDEPVVNFPFRREPGVGFYEYFIQGYAGVDPANGESLWYTDASQTETTNDYDQAERYYQGSALPDFFGGLTNTFSYKGVSLSFMFYFNIGNEIYNRWSGFTDTDGRRGLSTTGNMSRRIYERRWQEPGDVTDIPKIMYQGNQSAGASSRFLYSGDFVRLRDITLAYTLPSSILQKIKMSNIRVYVRANNLLTIKDEDVERDPETRINGVLDQNLPVSRQILFGLDLSF